MKFATKLADKFPLDTRFYTKNPHNMATCISAHLSGVAAPRVLYICLLLWYCRVFQWPQHGQGSPIRWRLHCKTAVAYQGNVKALLSFLPLDDASVSLSITYSLTHLPHLLWWRGSLVRTSVSGWWTFPDLRLIYGWHVTTSWVRCPLWVNQPGQLSLPSLHVIAWITGMETV